jgi:lysophospholipase L1-like esterase
VARVGLKAIVRRLLTIALPATVVAVFLAIIAVEIWVRWSWDDRQGRPGFFLSDPELGQRLAPNYQGWFAGVPVRINALGFRDDRDFELEKPRDGFRILVFGDSVTFGHGARIDTTYPALLERRLREWRPERAWQVWNLGVPGYATSQELAYLKRVAPAYRPDLVVVGFYPNDFMGNEPAGPPSRSRRASSAALRAIQGRLYSYAFYKRVYLTAHWRLFADPAMRQRLEHLVKDEVPLLRADFATSENQELTAAERFSEDDIGRFSCGSQPAPNPREADELRARLQNPDQATASWLAAVRGFREASAALRVPLVFFVNMAPEVCAEADRFYDGGSLAVDDVTVAALGQPAVSSTRAFLAYRPSQMPAAAAHSVGNANRVKADVLFAFLRDRVGIADRGKS